jgi:hypothetical protein
MSVNEIHTAHRLLDADIEAGRLERYMAVSRGLHGYLGELP